MTEYIDRKALGIGLVKEEAFGNNKAYAIGWNACIKIINTAPAADVVQVVHARAERFSWTTSDYDYAGQHPKFICSECRLIVSDADHYCRHCGAKMDKNGRGKQ